MSDTKVKVAVRVRPMNRREIELSTKCVVDMEENQTILHPPPSNNTKGENSRRQSKVFAFDHCFWSMDESNMLKYADQEVVFQCLGEGVLDNAFQGYNACIFAYGQTGSGKSFSMMGSGDNPGLIPRLCGALFRRVALLHSPAHSFKVEVSYMEIYNEKVRDLLDPKGSGQSLKVREHKVLGPYVDGLSQLAVTNFEDIDSLMSEGNKSRTVAATNMNEESSRSHGVFCIIVTQTLCDLQSGNSGEKVSKMSLVDLAGSERVSKTGAAGERLKEGSNINKSLTTLGCVISALADASSGKGKNKFVPYRDSVLTWLLKDSLGGNSKTAMIATVSPAADNYEETLSTLRYADRAKRIVNHAVVNEDPNARIIRELREEVEKLRDQLNQAESLKAPELKDRLEESEKLIQEMTVTWEEKLRKTEEIAQERQKQLESMGISLESSGIKVGEDKCFLVNLNADPALNELLVYYLKDHSRVGADTSQDIQLFGIGIQPEHCCLDISPEGDVTLSPVDNARTCVNGMLVHSPVNLWHGDRILWGNNHFFRINLPKRKRRERLKRGRGAERDACADGDVETTSETASEASSEQDYSYEFAQMEVMMKTLASNDPTQTVVHALEKQYLQEKHTALEEQRVMYERELQSLRQQLSPERPAHHHRLTNPTHTPHAKQRLWTEERDELFRQSLARLREQVVRANTLVREATYLSEEMNTHTDYQVTLQIPAANLSANRKRGAIVSEPAIQVRRKGRGTQVWNIEKLENKLVDMREQYTERRGRVVTAMKQSKRPDPFYEAQENHNLIGVANIFLECLFHDVKLQYAVPIISQQGEVAGRLHVELMRVSGVLLERVAGSDDSSENSSESYEVMEPSGEMVHLARKLTCRVCIREATGLPPSLSNFVFCQYGFWGQAEPAVAPPMVSPDTPTHRPGDGPFTVRFDHCKDYVVHVTEEFVEFICEGALAIEVWGHRCAGNGSPRWQPSALQAKTRTLQDRWSEVSRQLELWVSIQELNEQGEYSAVELSPAKDVNTGGVFQLRQGHSRRLLVCVRPVQFSGTLPLLVEALLSVSVGCVSVRSTKLQRPLDSYQEEDGEVDSYQEDDLNCVRQRWSEALVKRREYLDEQIKKIINKPDKSEEDMEREARLVEQWVGLTEERNAVLVPAPGSGIPGAPAHWTPSPGMEVHTPVLFLDLNADSLAVSDQLTGPQIAGVNSILPKEHGSQFFYLPIIRHSDEEVSGVCSWDSSIHDSPHLNRITGPGERIYLIVKATVQLTHPANMELVLRKRIAVNIYNKQSFTQSLKRRMSLKNTLYSCGVTYEVVSNIPKASEEAEERETLALMAARGEVEEEAQDGETYIEKYTRGVLEVENILSLERLRQAVMVKEALSVKNRHIRRSLSTPNVQHSPCCRGELSGCEDEDFKSKCESQQDLTECVFQDPTVCPSSTPTKNRENHGSAPESPVWLSSPFKVLPVQPQRFLQALLPVREEQGGGREARPLLGQESMRWAEESSPLPPACHWPHHSHRLTQPPQAHTADSDEEECVPLSPTQDEPPPFQPYVPEEFANFEVYNASLEASVCDGSLEAGVCVRGERGRAGASVCEREECVSRSPTVSSCTSGYFSHSASSATLSDAAQSDATLGETSQSDATLGETSQSDATLGDVALLNSSSSDQLSQDPTHTTEATPTHSHSPSSLSPPLFVDCCHGDGDALTPPAPPLCTLSTSPEFSDFQRAGEGLGGGGSWPPLAKLTSLTPPTQALPPPLHNGQCAGPPQQEEEGGPVEQLPDWMAPGELVWVGGHCGTVRYVGGVEFAAGIWVGVELELAVGKHNGTVQGRVYFRCEGGHGVLVQPAHLSRHPPISNSAPVQPLLL
ncbi:LOW QUALITY PROTEIN: kinesin-like protein KIF13A [Clupea harengus]|uniref:LOW QUALITY PROTEIN: kinesin-like protein KIF13A n=1 Tax=Clupea harengus TaxID=7950 RepID=A0A6P8FV18_CLUHA|nr:LOW QUALITY PROTEIN: kinesin-like protein KIF13A [Clupea harengus]